MKNLPFFLLLYCVAVDGICQSSISFKQLTTSSGEEIIGVHEIFKDTEGYVWLGSGGHDLIRFDGKNTRKYGSQDLQTNYFKSSRARLIFEDRNKNLWIGTDVGALMRFDRQADKFLLANDSATSIKYTLFCYAEANDGSFWLGTLGGGLIRFHPGTKEFSNYSAIPNEPNSIPDNYVTGLAFDSTGKLWIGTTSGLCYYDSSSSLFKRVELHNANPNDTYRYRVIRSIVITKSDMLYAGTYGGLQIVNLRTNNKEHLTHNNRDSESLSHNSLFDIVENKDNTLWIASYGGGLNLYDPKSKKFKSWKNDESDSESLSSNNLSTVYMDDKGLLWVGIDDNRLCVHNTKAKKFNSIVSQGSQPHGISSGWVQTVYQQNDSIFWLGLNGNGLNQLNLNTGVAKKFLNDPSNPFSLGDNSVVSIDQDNEKNIWVGLAGRGINKFNLSTQKFTRFEYDAKKNSINNNAVSTLLIDHDNYIWTTTFRSGLSIYNINQNKFININDDSLLKKTGISLASVRQSFELDQNIWFKSKDQLVVYDKKHNQFSKIEIEEGATAAASTTTFLEVLPYSETEMLLITRDEIKTVRYFEPQHIEQKTILKRPLNDDFFRSFVVGRKNEFWYITKDHVVKWNPQSGEKRIYSKSDGIVASDLTSLLLDAQGRIFVTSLNGLNWFWPHEIVDDTVSRKIVFTDFKLYNHSIGIQTPDSITNYSLPGHVSQLKKIVLDHSQSFFSIEFTAFEFMAPDKVKYAYKLNGFDREWVNVGNQNFASYTNLDPGEYTFHVKAANPDGFWGTQIASLEIIVTPPYWQAWWFISGSLLFVCGLIYSLHRYRLTQTLRVEQLRNKIASDLHDEVGSNLTRISIYSELIQDGEDEINIKSHLNRIGSISREVITTMSDIVWSIDGKSDTYEALFLRMKDFAVDILHPKNIELDFSIENIDINKRIDPRTKQNIYLIFKEAVTNVVKHAQASWVQVRIVITDKKFVMTINDNGIGIPAEIGIPGNGLSNMRRRALAIHAELIISNLNGTHITLQAAEM